VTADPCAYVVLVATFSWALVGCESRPEQVHFVLPDGYCGAFAVKPDDPDGIELQKKDGRYVIRIPERGVLKIKGHDPFRSYLNTASFASGERIWVSKRIDDKPRPGEIALWSSGTRVIYEGERPINFFWWFVGTEEQWKASDNESRHRAGGVIEKGHK
jgi:hypothetical protein